MSNPVLPGPSGRLAVDIQGVWWLLSREDWTKSGERRIDPLLGSNPAGILCYAKTHFAAQFMRRDKTEATTVETFSAGQNNTLAVDGYDAYFGSYQVNEHEGQVAHTIIGSISASNIGMTVIRSLRANQDNLTIQLETTTTTGEPITRTLTWKRIS